MRGEVVAQQPYRLTVEDLEAMRKEFVPRRAEGDKALRYRLEDDLRQIRISRRLGVGLEEWAASRGVPHVYAAALRRYLEQERLWDPPEEDSVED